MRHRTSPLSDFISRIAVFLLLLSALGAFATKPADAAGGVSGARKGSVVDLKTGAPISSASVTAVSGSGVYRNLTDAHGFFAFLQVPTDTYTVTASKDGYLSQAVSGVTVLGDQVQNVGVIRLEPSVKTLGSMRIVARAASSAFQPNQTVDETTISGARVDQALGQKGS